MVLSTKDIAGVAKSFLPGELTSFRETSPFGESHFIHLTFFRRWFPSLQHFSSLNKPDHQDDESDDQQDMNNSTQGVAAHQPQKP